MSISIEIVVILICFMIPLLITVYLSSFCTKETIIKILEKQLKSNNNSYNEKYSNIFQMLFVVGCKRIDFFKLSEIEGSTINIDLLYSPLFDKNNNIVKQKYTKNIMAICILIFITILNITLLFTLDFHFWGVMSVLFFGIIFPSLYIAAIIEFQKEYNKYKHPEKTITLLDIAELYYDCKGRTNDASKMSALWKYPDELSRHQEVQDEIFNYLEILFLYAINDTWDNLDSITEGLIKIIDTFQETLSLNKKSLEDNGVAKELLSLKESQFYNRI